MKANFCKQCGSNNFIADRSLGGRIICASCGLPSGSNPLIMNSSYQKSRAVRSGKLNFIIMFILALLFVLIVI